MLVDVSETSIERPKQTKKYFSGKKKKHTLKAQIIVNQKNGQILCTAYGKGKEHDFKLYKKTTAVLSWVKHSKSSGSTIQ